MNAANPYLRTNNSKWWFTTRIRSKDQASGKWPCSYAYKIDGNPLAEHWYDNNQLHRLISGFHSIFSHKNAVRQEEWYYRAACIVGAPAVTIYGYDGTILCQQWCEAGKLHREDGPAWIEYYPGQDCYKEMWYRRGKLHRRCIGSCGSHRRANRQPQLLPDGVQK